jgi:hydroxyacylglutathione hydrolase
VAPQLAACFGAGVALHPDDLPVWRLTHAGRDPDQHLADGQVLTVAGTDLHVLHTPGGTAQALVDT